MKRIVLALGIGAAVLLGASTASGTPSNDSVFAQKDVSGSLQFAEVADTTGATFDSAESRPSCAPPDFGATIWYRWDAPAGSGTTAMVADTFGSSFDSLLLVRDASTGFEVGCSADDSGGTDARVAFTAIEGHRYAFQVGGQHGAAGSLHFELTPPGVPTEPTQLSAARGTDAITVTWDAPLFHGGYPIDRFDRYRREAGSSFWSFEGWIEPGARSWIDTNVSRGTTYEYAVSAVNALGEGPWAPAVGASLFDGPSAPRNLSGTTGSGSIELTWDPPESDGGTPILDIAVWKLIGPGAWSAVGSCAPTPPCTISGLSGATTATYGISARNEVGQGPISDGVTLTTGVTAPGAPRFPSARGDVKSIRVSWGPPQSDGGSPITLYDVYRSTTSGGATFWGATTDTFFIDTGLPDGAQYFYKVLARNSAGVGPLSAEVSATTHSPPSEPRAVAVTRGLGSLTVSWSEPDSSGDSPLAGYRVYRGSTSGSEIEWTRLFDATRRSVTYTDLGNGTTLFFRVSANNASMEGPQSDEAFGTTFTPPSAPRALTATGGNRSVTVRWELPAADGGTPVRVYRVYRTSSSSNELPYRDIGGASTGFIDNDLEEGAYYAYRVTAINDAGESSLSDRAAAVTWSRPSVPLSVRATPGSTLGAIDVSWSQPNIDGGAAVMSYAIYRSTTSSDPILVATVSASARSYTDLGRMVGQTYTYWVSATNAVGEGPRSEPACAKPFPWLDMLGCARV